MVIFGPKPWVNLLEKSQFFDFLNFLFLLLRKRFFLLEYRQTFSWRILPKKNKLEKWPFLDQNHRLTPLEKSQFLDILNFLFLQLRKASSFVQQNVFDDILEPKKRLSKL